jgi:hypothetical protein
MDSKKKFPRREVIEKQLTVVIEEEPESISDEVLEEVTGGNLAGAANSMMRQLYIMYGVPRPPFRPGMGGQWAGQALGTGSTGNDSGQAT